MLKSLTFVLLTLFVFSISSIQSAKAQETGFIRGNVIDGDEGVPLYGATVRIKELPGVGTISDFDGNYSISLAPGFYTVEVSFVSFQAQVFTDVEVKAKETTIIDVVLETKTTAVV